MKDIRDSWLAGQVRVYLAHSNINQICVKYVFAVLILENRACSS